MAEEKPNNQNMGQDIPAVAPGSAVEPAQQEKPAAAAKPRQRSRKQAGSAPQQAAASEAQREELLFGKYSLKDVVVRDQSIANYINLLQKEYPNTFGRRKDNAYYSAHVGIVERLVNKLMRGGTGGKVGGRVVRTEGKLQGKKIKVMHIVEKAFEIVSKQSNANPVQKLVDALSNAAPIEDTTRVRYGGIAYNVAVDISSKRRLDVALRNLALASILGAFNKKTSLAEALANEIMLAANNDPNSYAIKQRINAERMAKSAR
ncbi:MAG: 30S ribosomal protein S7 [Candidatus Micrarchaeaceae archaeon]